VDVFVVDVFVGSAIADLRRSTMEEVRNSGPYDPAGGNDAALGVPPGPRAGAFVAGSE
jgi:hypothetical protein